MAYDGERIADAALSLLQGALADQLDAVEALWADNPITLPEPVSWVFGHKPTVLELASADFPLISLIPTGRTPIRNGYAWGEQSKRVRLYVDFFVVAEDEVTCNRLANRYTEALVGALQEQQNLYGYDQVDYESQVELSEASRHTRTPDADMFEDDQVDFIQGGRITVELEG